MALSPYEEKAWKRLQARKEASLRKKTRKILPAAAQEKITAGANKAKSMPGASQAWDAYSAGVRGLGKAAGNSAARTVSPKGILKQYQKADHVVLDLSDIHGLDLEAIDQVARLNRIRYGHSLTAAAGGAGSGAVVTGGGLLVGLGSVAGAGAGAAPGIGAVAGAMAADAAAVLGLASRAVAATALYYGYDPHEPEEEVFMMSVIGLGMASGTSAKSAAYSELSQLTQMLVRRAPWAKLNEKVFTKVVQKFAARFSFRLTQKKLGQFVPVAGVAVGAGLNYLVIDQIAVAAQDAYRERFLVDKSGGTLTPQISAPAGPGVDDSVSVIDILEEEGLIDGETIIDAEVLDADSVSGSTHAGRHGGTNPT